MRAPGPPGDSSTTNHVHQEKKGSWLWFRPRVIEAQGRNLTVHGATQDSFVEEVTETQGKEGGSWGRGKSLGKGTADRKHRAHFLGYPET